MPNGTTAGTSLFKSQRWPIVSESSRAHFRKQRQVEIEQEQKKEEAEALRHLMDQSQHQHLIRSLSSVKTEFSDLDGVKWSGSMLRRRAQKSVPNIKIIPPSAAPSELHSAYDDPPSPALSDFGVVECTPLASTFSDRDIEPPFQEETIRACNARRRYRTRLPSLSPSPCSSTFPEFKSIQSHSPRVTSPRRTFNVARPLDQSSQPFPGSESESLHDPDDEDTIRIPIHSDEATDHPSRSPVKESSAMRTVRAPRTPFKLKANGEGTAMVGRVFCREYELGLDGQPKPGVPGRWHAVEGLRVELP